MLRLFQLTGIRKGKSLLNIVQVIKPPLNSSYGKQSEFKKGSVSSLLIN
jgi:hypothetical protein